LRAIRQNDTPGDRTRTPPRPHNKCSAMMQHPPSIPAITQHYAAPAQHSSTHPTLCSTRPAFQHSPNTMQHPPSIPALTEHYAAPAQHSSTHPAHQHSTHAIHAHSRLSPAYRRLLPAPSTVLRAGPTFPKHDPVQALCDSSQEAPSLQVLPRPPETSVSTSCLPWSIAPGQP
jgi:hypothetical protein